MPVPSWKATWTWHVGHEPSQACSGSLEQLVGDIERPPCMRFSQRDAEPPGRVERLKKSDDGSPTGQVLAIEGDEVPILGALVWRQIGKQLIDDRVVKTDEREFVVGIEFGDKTCRGSAESSATCVDQGGPCYFDHCGSSSPWCRLVGAQPNFIPDLGTRCFCTVAPGGVTAPRRRGPPPVRPDQPCLIPIV